MSDAYREPTPAKIAHVGEWRIDFDESGEMATFALHYPPSASNSSGPTALATLGLTAEALRGGSHPLHFELRREAGTFVCRGAAADGRGPGSFRFHPDRAYADAIAEIGMPPLTLRKQVGAGLFNVSLSFTKTIVTNGLPYVTFSQLIALKIARITAEYVTALCWPAGGTSIDEVAGLHRNAP